MSVLPIAVRMSLWATAAWSQGFPIARAVEATHRGIDHAAGALDRLDLWHDFGERVVLVALPRPGDITGLPRGSAELVDSATSAGQCVYVPTLGGALVPEVATFGSVDDHGTQVSWTAYESDPVAPHVLESISLREVEVVLREQLAESTDAIDALQAAPWDDGALRRVADRRTGGGGLGLPDGVPARALRLLSLAGTVHAALELGLSTYASSGAVDAMAGEQRRVVMSRLYAGARPAIAAASNVAAMTMAGLRPGG